MTITKVLTPVAFVALMALAATPASAGQHRGDSGHGGGRSHESSRSHSSGGYRGGGGGYYGHGPSYYRPSYRPYYSFRPRVNLGFGLSLGYPVYSYPYPYTAYADPYAYGAAPAPSYAYPAQPYASPNQYAPPSQYGSGAYDQGYPSAQSAPSMGVQRGGNEYSTGGVSLEITPGNAAVFVDGTYVGTAGEFGPRSQPLGLSAGRHRVEVRASGYRTMSFDADVRPGQVLPYQGTLQRN